jgi:hypothetical protein
MGSPPVMGRPFVVTVGERRIYFGAFWNLASSVTWNGIAITYHSTDSNRLEISSPTGMKDLLNDSELLEIMKSAGKN